MKRIRVPLVNNKDEPQVGPKRLPLAQADVDDAEMERKRKQIKERLTTPTQAQIDKADKLAVKIVTLVSERISKDGKLYAYDGIEAAREIRRLILDEMS